MKNQNIVFEKLDLCGTWKCVSSCGDLDKDRLAFQCVFHGVDADVVQLSWKKVAERDGRCRVWEVELRAFAFHRGRVDHAIAWRAKSRQSFRPAEDHVIACG